MENAITTNSPTVEVEVTLELNDCVRANYWVLFKRFGFALIGLSIIGLPLFILVIVNLLNPNVHNFNWPALIPFSGVVLLLVQTYIVTRRNLAGNKALQQRIRYTFSEYGFEALSASSSGRSNWENIPDAYETKHNFLLFIAKNLMYTIPKRCFSNPEDIRNFRT